MHWTKLIYPHAVCRFHNYLHRCVIVAEGIHGCNEQDVLLQALRTRRDKYFWSVSQHLNEILMIRSGNILLWNANATNFKVVPEGEKYIYTWMPSKVCRAWKFAVARKQGRCYVHGLLFCMCVNSLGIDWALLMHVVNVYACLAALYAAFNAWGCKFEDLPPHR